MLLNSLTKLTKSFVFMSLFALAACQTVPPQTGFNQEQISLLEQHGFEKEGENYELDLASKVLFGFDSSELNPETAANLHDMVGQLVQAGISGAWVEGHTDGQGAEDYNMRLSEQRAEAVKQALVTGSMSAERVRAIGFGESDPVESNETEEGRAQNRRVVIVITPGDVLPL